MKEGLGFDGSSIRGFQAINESDMLLIPDLSTAFVDPVLEVPTLSITCDIYDPITLEPYSRDPRFIAFKAEEYLKTTGIATTSYWGPEAEFFIFNSVRFDQNAHEGYYHIDSDEGIWNSGRNGTPNLRASAAAQRRLFPGPAGRPAAGCAVEDHAGAHRGGHPGRGAAPRGGDRGSGRDRLPLRHAGADRRPAAGLQVHRQERLPQPGPDGHVHAQAARSATTAPGCTATSRSGRTVLPLFFDAKGYALLSDTARWYIGGLITHAPALLGLCAPTTNSYRRLVPGFEAPVNLMYSQRNRSAICRIPTYSDSPKARRVEFRAPDPSCNPYLAFSAMLMAGLDGVKRKIEPPKPIDEDLYELHDDRKATHQDRSRLAAPKPWTRWRRITPSCSRAMSSRRT